MKTTVVRKMKRDRGYQGYTSSRLRTTPVADGLPTVSDMRKELQEYWDVLTGRTPSPVTGAHALQEVADQYYARASELTSLIQDGEIDGTIAKGSELARYRTGPLRTFREVAGKAAELGSRRLTAIAVQAEQSRLGRESAS
jgi:hypothetical protein